MMVIVAPAEKTFCGIVIASEDVVTLIILLSSLATNVYGALLVTKDRLPAEPAAPSDPVIP